MSKGIELVLRDSSGTLMSNLTDLEVAWFDNDTVLDLSLSQCNTITATTDGSGLLKLNLDNVTGLDTGEWGFLLCYLPDNSDYKQSPVFAGRMQITTVTGGTDMLPTSTWVRNPEWLALPDVTGLQKFAGLFAVYPDSNFVALSAEGNFTINWGDGSGNINVSSGVTAERNIAWADADPASEVGIASAVAVTFTDSGDTVNRTAHGFSNGQEVSFASITGTTGISTYTRYWVVNIAANTFQVSATVGGTALTLTTDGSGTVYIPQYRQVLITVVPNASNITKFDLHIKHSQSGLATGVNVAWLDIVMSAQYMTDLRVGVGTPGSTTRNVILGDLERFGLLSSDLRNCCNLFYSAPSLANISAFETSTAPAVSAACTFTDTGDLVSQTAHGFRNGDPIIFTTITTTTGILSNSPYYVRDVATDSYKVCTTVGGTAVTLTTNGSGTAVKGTSLWGMFKYCNKLAAIPLINTAAVIDFSEIFYGANLLRAFPLWNTSAGIRFIRLISSYSLRSVAMIDTSAGATFSGMFIYCYGLKSAPHLNTSAGVDFSQMFRSCSELKTIPLLDTSAGLYFQSMVQDCYALESFPLIDTSAGISFDSMFLGCSLLQTVPAINTAAGTGFSYMFYNCTALQSVPLFNTAAGTNFYGMFEYCTALSSVPLFNTAAGTNFGSMFYNCSSLQSVPLLNSTSSVSFASMFGICAALRSGRLEGTKESISYANCKLSAAELNSIYTGLATVTAKTITVTGNWGTTGDDPTIATAKGWTVTG